MTMTDELQIASWRAQMLETIARYAHFMDAGAFDEIEELFSEDAIFDIAPDPGIVKVPVQGKRAIREQLEARFGVVSQTAQRRHLMTTTMFDEIGEDEARARTFLTVVSVSKTGGGLTLHGSGVYHDRLVRVGEGWVFAERRLLVDDLNT